MDIVANIKMDGGFASDFNSNIVKEITKKVKRESLAIKTNITDQLRKAVREALVLTPEYQSILRGKLKAELGIPNSSSRIMAIIDTWINNIVVTIKTGTTPFLLIDIGIVKGDYSDVLSLPEAQYTYKSRRSQGEIPWLRWLLLEGDKRIITRYEFSNNPKGSRTGMGIMIAKEKGVWQVPPEFSGTAVDNFATRALGNIGNIIDKIVEKAIRSRFK